MFMETIFSFQPHVLCYFRSVTGHQWSLYIFTSHGGLLVLCWCNDIAAHDRSSEKKKLQIKTWLNGRRCQFYVV